MLWPALDRLAKTDNLDLIRSPGGVTIYFTIGGRIPAMTITTGDLTDEDADTLLRKLTERALKLLKELNP